MHYAGPNAPKPYCGVTKVPLILSHVHYAGPNAPKAYCGVTKVPLILYMIILPERVRGLLCSEARHGQGLQTPFGHGAPVQCYFVSCLYLRA